MALNKELMKTFAARFNEIFNGPQLELVDELFAADMIDHLPLAPDLDR